jgi:hypothetical protein
MACKVKSEGSSVAISIPTRADGRFDDFDQGAAIKEEMVVPMFASTWLML